MLDIFTVSVWQMSTLLYNDVAAVANGVGEGRGEGNNPANCLDSLFIVSYSGEALKSPDNDIATNLRYPIESSIISLNSHYGN